MKKILYTILLLVPLCLVAQHRAININSRCNIAYHPTNTHPDLAILYDTLWNLLYGQSNMIGRPSKDPVLDTNTNPLVLQLSRGRYNGLDGELSQAQQPLEFQDSDAGDMGLGLNLGIQLQELTSSTIALQPEGVGGEPINSFMPGTLYWNQLVARAAILDSIGLQSVSWVQGESDASNFQVYLGKLSILVDSIHARFGNVPFLVGGLMPTFLYDEFEEPIQQKLIAAPDSIDNVHYVPSWGLYGSIDNLHFSAPALRRYGLRFGKAIAYVKHNILDIPEAPVFWVDHISDDSSAVYYDYVYAPDSIIKLEVYANNTLVASANNPAQTTRGGVIGVSSNLGGTPVYVRAQNNQGWSYSDTTISPYSASVPVPTHYWKLDETTGTTVADSLGTNNGTLSADASTVTTTLGGEPAFDFHASETITLASTIWCPDTFTVSFYCDPDVTVTSILGKPDTSSIFPNVSGNVIRVNTRNDGSDIVASGMNSLKKHTYVFTPYRVKVYIGGSYIAQVATVCPAIGHPFRINTLGGGHTGLPFDGKFKKMRYWGGKALTENQIKQL